MADELTQVVKVLVSLFRFACVLMSLCGMLAAGGPDAFIGIWKLDPQNSKFDGGTIYKSRTIAFAVTPAGLKMTSSGNTVDGRALPVSM